MKKNILDSLSGILSKMGTKDLKTTGTLNRACSIYANVKLFSFAYCDSLTTAFIQYSEKNKQIFTIHVEF